MTYLTMDASTAAQLRAVVADQNAMDPQHLVDGRFALATSVLEVDWDAATAALLRACQTEEIADDQFAVVAAAVE